jgi:hypothetical protein
MPLKPKDVAACLEVLFKRLDAAKLAPETILKSEAHREHYESILMFAFRKLQAARYHHRRVEELLDLQRKELTRLQETSRPKGQGLATATATVRISRSADELTFELCAFLAAIRSGIDFLARASAQHLKGVQADSITTLLGLVNDGKTGPILKVVAQNAEWLLWLREYRDYLVHRLVIQATGGGQVQWKQGKAVATPFPVVVPSKTQTNVPDTRRARAFDEPESRFNVATSEAFITDGDGKKHLIEHSVEMEPADGYIRIEDLMKRDLAAFEHFFVKIVEVLTELDFAPMPLEKGSSKAPA